MKPNNIIDSLSKEFPGKKIIALPHAEYSKAVAYILESKPHYHRVSTETYIVNQGVLELWIEGRKEIIKKGNWTKVIVKSTPGWVPADHFISPNYHTL